VLNLDEFQRKQAETQKAHADQTVALRIPETFQWLLIPEQSDPKGPVGWKEVRLKGQEALAVRASRKTGAEEERFLTMGGSRLRLEIDRVPPWRAAGRATASCAMSAYGSSSRTSPSTPICRECRMRRC